MDLHAKQDWWGTSQNTGASSCICGWNFVDIMQIFYNEDCAMCRVTVTAHEYYHVLQMHYCQRCTTIAPILSCGCPRERPL